MEKFTTETEKQLFGWLWKSQLELAKKLLKERNDELLAADEENTWPAQQEWDDMLGSSHAIFLRAARDLSGIPHDIYLKIIRENEDAMIIIDELIGD